MKDVWRGAIKPIILGVLMILLTVPMFVLMLVFGIPWAIGNAIMEDDESLR